MTFENPFWFILFLLVWVVGGNVLAYLTDWHVNGLFGYCTGYGC